MVEKSTFLASSRVICRLREFAKSCPEIHAEAEWCGRTLELDIGRSDEGDARREVHAPDLLAQSNPDNYIHSKSSIYLRDKCVTIRTIFRAEVKLGAPVGV